ncbi:hypothetical protein HMPREF1572_00361 [Gardnerella vaginalis JCP7275]|nr:hypothetical protein HMPREF1572_00361 [Gardnerella vaginalis JCP7275]
MENSHDSNFQRLHNLFFILHDFREKYPVSLHSTDVAKMLST